MSTAIDQLSDTLSSFGFNNHVVSHDASESIDPRAGIVINNCTVNSITSITSITNSKSGEIHPKTRAEKKLDWVQRKKKENKKKKILESKEKRSAWATRLLDTKTGECQVSCKKESHTNCVVLKRRNSRGGRGAHRQPHWKRVPVEYRQHWEAPLYDYYADNAGEEIIYDEDSATLPQSSGECSSA